VVGVDPVPARRDLAAKLGFDECLPPQARPSTVPELVADVHVEASGDPAATLPVIQCNLTPASRCVLVSRTGVPSMVDTNPWVSSAARLIGSRGQSGGVFPYLIRLFASEQLAPHALIAKAVSLTEIPDILAAGDLTTPGKIVCRPAQDDARPRL
jgi:threonine dehydrogenase-like Zn-dependent dehydrogenase